MSRIDRKLAGLERAHRHLADAIAELGLIDCNLMGDAETLQYEVRQQIHRLRQAKAPVESADP